MATPIISKIHSAQEFDDIVYGNKRKKVILILGQSNVYAGLDFGHKPIVTGELDLRVKALSATFSGSNENGFVPMLAGVSSIDPDGLDTTQPVTGAGFTLAKALSSHLDEEVSVVVSAKGDTSFTAHNWSAFGAEHLRAVNTVSWLAANNYDIELIVWMQGESDSGVVSSRAIAGQLYAFFNKLRHTAFSAGQNSGLTIPIVTFDMNTAYVGTSVERLRTQAVLENIGSVVPFTANIDSTTLPPDSDSDLVHYEAEQLLAMGGLFFDSYLVAKGNNLTVNVPLGDTLIYRQVSTASSLTDEDLLLEPIGSSINDDRYSRLIDTWKYANGGKFRFRMEWDVIGGATESITFEQQFVPWMSRPSMMPASLLHATSGARFGDKNNSGFTGLSAASNWAVLVALSSSNIAIAPLGKVDSSPDGFQMRKDDLVSIYASEVRLYAIKL